MMSAEFVGGTAAEQSWTNLVAAEEELSEAAPPSLQGPEFDRFLTAQSQRAAELANRFRAHERQYPSSPHASEAWEKWMDLLAQAAIRLPEKRAELEKMEEQSLTDPKLNMRQRETILNNQLERTGDTKERERIVRHGMAKVESPTAFFCQHMLTIAEFSDYLRARTIVDEILNLRDGVETPEWYSNNVVAPRSAAGWIAGEKATLQYYQGMASKLKRTLDRVGQPLKLKFTAFNGTPVDIDQFRGKVVLLEFWATWCPPCVAGIPKVRAAWDALHKEGFEVIGLSYDTDSNRLKHFLEKNPMPWPQFFGAEGKDSPLIKSLGQPGPPAYWLIDRQGILRDVNAHEAMQEKVKRLLGLTQKLESARP
jgi:peroxiredoxin